MQKIKVTFEELNDMEVCLHDDLSCILKSYEDIKERIDGLSNYLDCNMSEAIKRRSLKEHDHIMEKLKELKEYIGKLSVTADIYKKAEDENKEAV